MARPTIDQYPGSGPRHPGTEEEQDTASVAATGAPDQAEQEEIYEDEIETEFLANVKPPSRPPSRPASATRKVFLAVIKCPSLSVLLVKAKSSDL